MDKDFYAELLRDALDGLMSRQSLSESQKRQLQYFLMDERSVTDASLRDMLNTQDLNQQQVEDLIWLLRMVKNGIMAGGSHELLGNITEEFQHYHDMSVFGNDSSQVRMANERVSHRGEMFIREIAIPTQDMIGYARLCIFLYSTHTAIDRNPLALLRAREGRMLIEQYVGDDFVTSRNITPQLRQLYIHLRFAELSSMRTLANPDKPKSYKELVQSIQVFHRHLQSGTFGEVQDLAMWRLHLLREELKAVSHINRGKVGEIDGLYGQAQNILSRHTDIPQGIPIALMQTESEMTALLKARSSRDGLKLALVRAEVLSVERLHTLPLGISHKIGILRSQALLRYKMNEMDAVTHILEKAYHMANEAGLSHQLSLITQDAVKFGIE